MVVVLDEVTLRKSHPICLARIDVDSRDVDRRNCVVLGAAPENALHAALSSSEFVQSGVRESVRPGNLASDLPRVVQGRELRHWRGCARQQKGAEKADIKPVFFEALVDASEILRAV